MTKLELLQKERRILTQRIPMYEQLAFDAANMRLDYFAWKWHQKMRRATNRLREVNYLIQNF